MPQSAIKACNAILLATLEKHIYLTYLRIKKLPVKKFIPILLLLTVPALQLSAQYTQVDFAKLYSLKGTWKMDKKRAAHLRYGK